MKTRLMLSVAAAIVLATAPAFAQQTVGDNSSGSTSNSGSNSNAQLNNQVGPSNSSVGPIDSSVRVGPSTSDSQSTSGSIAGSTSISRGGDGGNSDAHSTATGGTSSAVTGASSSTANNAASNAGNAQNITFNSTTPEKTKLETTPQVYAPALTTTLTETCMGSTSGGISVMGFGGTLGTTWEDKSCKRRLDARELAQTIGDRDAALALLCQDEAIARAYQAIGRSCMSGAPRPVAVNTTPPQPLVTPPPPPPPPESTVTMKPIPNPPEKAPRGSDGERG